MKTPDRRKAFDAYMSRMIHVLRDGAPLESLAIRQCGDCTMCCSAPAIDSSQIEPHERGFFKPKPSGDTCQHCTKGGCGIYQKRPSICHGYLCLYLAGLTDRNPMDGKVCWTFQPCMQTGGTLAVGHCHDIDEVMRDVDNRADMRAFMALQGFAPVSTVVLRSPTQVARFDATGMLPDLMADIDPADPIKMTVDDSTQRRAQWKV